MSDKRTTTGSTNQPHYVGWRGEMLAKLALSRLDNVTIVAQPLHGQFDLSVMTQDALTFLVEVKAFSSIQQNIVHPEVQDWLECEVPVAALNRARNVRPPVIIFLFDADTGHGRFMRVDEISLINATRKKYRMRFPVQNTITTASLNLLINKLKSGRTSEPLPFSPALPSSTSKVVIFDTNAYRNLTYGCNTEESRTKTLALRQKEKDAGVMALANPFVIWELVGHLADKADPAYEHCLNALVALAEHTWSQSDPNIGLCLIADGETSVCRELFRLNPPNAEQNARNLSLLAAYVKNYAPNISDPAVLINMNTFASMLKQYEAEWLKQVQNVLEGLKPDLARAWIGGANDTQTRRKLRAIFESQSYMDAWANAMVIKFSEIVGVRLSAQDLAENAEIMKKVFPVPFHLMAHALREWPGNKSFKLDSPKKKRANFVWDSALCFSIGNYSQVGEALVVFVTDDAAIRKAAEDAKCPNRVLCLKDYFRSVDFDSK